jgi:Outer membrane protein transport protein (OMPP1/FadL/TodX)
MRISRIVSIILLLLTSPVLAEDYYGAYGLFPQGSTRVMAMGGAFVALSDDMAGSQYNSAGLVMTPWWGDLGGNTNVVYNLETDLNGDGKKDGIPYAYANYAAAIHTGKWAFGLGVSSPYVVDLEFKVPNAGFEDTRRLKLAVLSVNFPVAYRINEEWAVGIVLHSQAVSETYKKTSTNPATTPLNIEAAKTAGGTSYGVVWRPNTTWGLGFAGTPTQTFHLDATALNAQGDGVNWFRSVKIPGKAIFGGMYRPNPQWTFLMDLSAYEGINDAVYVGSELIAGYPRVEVDPSPKSVLHGGAEWHFVASDMWDCYFRFGGYSEPARLKNSYSRSHTTMGFEARFWALTFSVSLDAAPEFLNYAGGFGISLKPF